MSAIALVDVDYRDDGSALAACVLARAWTDSERTMHGPHRLPTLIGRADQLCRGR